MHITLHSFSLSFSRVYNIPTQRFIEQISPRQIPGVARVRPLGGTRRDGRRRALSIIIQFSFSFYRPTTQRAITPAIKT